MISTTASVSSNGSCFSTASRLSFFIGGTTFRHRQSLGVEASHVSHLHILFPLPLPLLSEHGGGVEAGFDGLCHAMKAALHSAMISPCVLTRPSFVRLYGFNVCSKRFWRTTRLPQEHL